MRDIFQLTVITEVILILMEANLDPGFGKSCFMYSCYIYLKYLKNEILLHC